MHIYTPHTWHNMRQKCNCCRFCDKAGLRHSYVIYSVQESCINRGNNSCRCGQCSDEQQAEVPAVCSEVEERTSASSSLDSFETGSSRGSISVSRVILLSMHCDCVECPSRCPGVAASPAAPSLISDHEGEGALYV